MKKKAIISLCDRTGNMVIPWAENGYTCICVDIQNSIRATRSDNHIIKTFNGGGQIHHIYGDCRSWKPSMFCKDFYHKYDIWAVFGFSPCTDLAGSGAQDWQLKGLAMLTNGLMLFNAVQMAGDWSGARYMSENPVGAITRHYREPDHIFHPWHYGDMYSKKTCLWVGNGFVMPKPIHTKEPPGVTQKIWLAPPTNDRADIRSETPMGFARAVFEANKYW